jgi:hypothetical protein
MKINLPCGHGIEVAPQARVARVDHDDPTHSQIQAVTQPTAFRLHMWDSPVGQPDVNATVDIVPQLLYVDLGIRGGATICEDTLLLSSPETRLFITQEAQVGSFHRYLTDGVMLPLPVGQEHLEVAPLFPKISLF